jgi:hypothetical protein
MIKINNERKFEYGKLYMRNENGKWVLVKEYPEYKNGIPADKFEEVIKKIMHGEIQ